MYQTIKCEGTRSCGETYCQEIDRLNTILDNIGYQIEGLIKHTIDLNYELEWLLQIVEGKDDEK